MSIFFATRAATRAVQATKDAAELMQQGRIAEALETLAEARQHLDTAADNLRDETRREVAS